MSREIWVDRHHVNLVYEKLVGLSKNGSTPVEEPVLMDALRREGLDLSRRELAKILLALEILGLVSIESTSGGREFRIKVRPAKTG